MFNNRDRNEITRCLPRVVVQTERQYSRSRVATFETEQTLPTPPGVGDLVHQAPSICEGMQFLL